jgi:hypothetical protein
MEWLTNNEVEATWKEEVVAYFNALFLHLPGGTEENNDVSLYQDLKKYIFLYDNIQVLASVTAMWNVMHG